MEATALKFEKVSCSNCGRIFGPGNHGFSHCIDHRAPNLKAAGPDMYFLLSDLEEYFANRADADCDQDGYIPNEEMKRLTEIREVMARAEGRSA